MQSQGVDPLAGLRDIHLPGSVSWWPPAPGWWWLAGGIFLALVLLGWWWHQRRRVRWQRQGRRAALQQLEHLRNDQLMQPDTLVCELSVLLRRAAILHYTAANCAGLSGQEWLRFLDRTLKESCPNNSNNISTTDDLLNNPFSAGAGRYLTDMPYRPPGNTDVDCAALLDLAQRWLESLPPLPHQPEGSSESTRRHRC